MLQLKRKGKIFSDIFKICRVSKKKTHTHKKNNEDEKYFAPSHNVA